MNHVLLALAPQYVKYGNQQAPNATANFKEYKELANSSGVAFVEVGSVTMEPCSDFVMPVNSLSIGGKGFIFHTETDNDGQREVYDNSEWGEECQGDLATYSAALMSKHNFTPGDIKDAQCHRNTTPCLKTQMVTLLQSFFYSFWFFGAIYYWSMWAFILVYFVSMVAYTCKNRKSIVQAMINDVQSDLDDSDDDMTPFKPSWGNSNA